MNLKVIEQEDFFTSGQRFSDLDSEAQAFVMSAMGVVDMNPKTIIVCKRVSDTEVHLEMRQLLSQEPSDSTIGVGETLYSKAAA